MRRLPAAATKLMARLTAGGEAAIEQAEAIAASDPVGAFLNLERIPAVYKGTPLAPRAAALLGKLKRDSAVAIELRAKPALLMVRKIDGELGSRPGSFDPTSPEFRQANGPLLQQLKASIVQMQQVFPMARSTQEALAIAERYGF